MAKHVIMAGMAGVLLAGATVAQAAAVPVDVQVKLFFKIATYDANLPPGGVQVGVVAPVSDAAAMQEILKAFEGLRSMTVNGRPLSTVAIPYSATADIAAACERGGLYGLFVASSVPDADIPALRDLAKTHRLFLFGQSAAHVALGLTSGLLLEGDRRVVLLNVPAAIEQGRQFDGNFIKACRVIR